MSSVCRKKCRGGDSNPWLIRLKQMAADLKHATGAEVRRLARDGRLTGPTCGLAEDYVQANLVVLPKKDAFDFLLFCHRNPKPCPVLDVTEPGSAVPR